MVSAKLSLFDWLLSSGEGTELSGFLKWNLISLNWNKLAPIIIIAYSAQINIRIRSNAHYI